MATRVAEAPTGAAVFTITDQEFVVGLFNDIREAIDRPGEEIEKAGTYIIHSDYDTSRQINQYLADRQKHRCSSCTPMARCGAWRWTTGEHGAAGRGAGRRRVEPHGAPQGPAADGRRPACPFVRVICDALTTAGVSPVVVVTRAELAGRLAAVLPGIALVVNPDPDRGQLSSLLLGPGCAGRS